MCSNSTEVSTNGHKRPKCQTQKTNKSMPDSNTIISVCTAILCRHHRPSMSLLQRVVFCMKDTLPSRLVCANLLIYCSAKVTIVPFFSLGQVYERLNRLLVCASHQSTIREIDRLGVDFDSRVKEWQASLLQRTALHMQVC